MELDHNVSKSATDAFWKLSCDRMPGLFRAKEIEQIRKKVPQFTHIRRSIYDKKSPDVDLQIGYANKMTGEVTEVNSNVTPTSQYPRSDYQKVYEIASVKVNFTD